uniref:Rgp1 n=2 Tax=Schistocephalus solidus TaxID=70667 RepID=A0A0X3Q466_SCHSO
MFSCEPPGPVHISARLIGLPTYLSGGKVRCEVVISYAPVSSEYPDRATFSFDKLSAVLVGQFRFTPQNLTSNFAHLKAHPPEGVGSEVLEDEALIAGLDPNSRVLWASHLLRKTLNQRLTIMANSSYVVSLKASLPGKLAPSYRGALIRIAYKAMLSWKISYFLGGTSSKQEGGHVASDVRVVHLPFRVLPSFHAYYTPTISSASISSLVTSAAMTESDFDSSVQLESTNPFSVFCKVPSIPNLSDDGATDGNGGLCFNDFLSVVNLHPLIVDRLTTAFKQSLQTTSDTTCFENLSQVRESGRRGNRKSSPPRSPSTVFAELVSSTSAATFVISAPEGHICRVGLFKTAARLGDCLNGYLDFRSAVVPCLQCAIHLEAYECVDRISEVVVQPNVSTPQNNSSALPLFTVPVQVAFTDSGKAPPKLPENARRTSWSEVQLDCANILLLPFSINIPLNAPPEFGLRSTFFKGIFQVRWGLNFQFKTSKMQQRSRFNSSESPGLFDSFFRKHSVRKKNDFTTVVYESGSVFPWALPISILPNGPGTFVFPSDSAVEFYPTLSTVS